jgi:hypothetical protein
MWFGLIWLVFKKSSQPKDLFVKESYFLPKDLFVKEIFFAVLEYIF